MTLKLVPPDRKRCQTMRPCTWPKMPSVMTLGPVTFTRCKNKPQWLATDGGGKGGRMSLCQECWEVCLNSFPTATAEPIKRRKSTA